MRSGGARVRPDGRGYKFIDLTGQTFGRLTVQKFVGKSKNRKSIWGCLCECGNRRPVQVDNLRNGHTQSCGCLQIEATVKGGKVQQTIFAKGDVRGKHNRLDLTDQTFGRLTVQKFVGYSPSIHSSVWECLCECGTVKRVKTGHLRSGHTASCGCSRHEKSSQTHGHTIDGTASSTYRSWGTMIQRCTNPKNTGYFRYGGAGVKVAPEWVTFEGFYASMGDRPEGTSIGRILDMGNYEPGNAFWQTEAEQKLAQRNKRALLKWTARNERVGAAA